MVKGWIMHERVAFAPRVGFPETRSIHIPTTGNWSLPVSRALAPLPMPKLRLPRTKQEHVAIDSPTNVQQNSWLQSKLFCKRPLKAQDLPKTDTGQLCRSYGILRPSYGKLCWSYMCEITPGLRHDILHTRSTTQNLSGRFCRPAQLELRITQRLDIL